MVILKSMTGVATLKILNRQNSASTLTVRTTFHVKPFFWTYGKIKYDWIKAAIGNFSIVGKVTLNPSCEGFRYRRYIP